MNSFRKPKGQAATALNLIFSVFILLLIGVFAWELSLYMLAKDELKTCVEVAALTCETTLCSSGDPTLPANQTNAVNTAYNLFAGNAILGKLLVGSQLVTSPSLLNPGPGTAAICFQFLDPVTRSVIAVIGVRGCVIEADGAYCYQPIFGRFLGLSNVTFTVLVSAQAGLPRTDVVICFDLCGAGDDATMVTFVQRFWDYQISKPHIVYNIPWIPALNGGAGGFAYGQLSSINCNPINPQTANVVWPQDLEQQQLNPTELCAFAYSEIPGPNGQNPTNAQYLAGPPAAPNGAVPPGNLCVMSGGIPATSSLPTKLEIARHHKRNLIGLGHPHKGKNGAMSILPSERSTGKATTSQPSVAKPAISTSPSDQVKLKACEDPGVGSNNLEDVFVDLNSAKDERSLSSKYSAQDIIAMAAPGPAAAPSTSSSTVSSSSSGTATYGTLVGPTGPLFVSGSSFPVTNMTPLLPLIPPVNMNPCTNQSTMSYATDPNMPPFLIGFTDLVQNLDNNALFAGGTWYGFTYNDLGVLVEAMRGSLESVATANAAGLDLAALNVTPQAGFQANYIQVASSNTQPFNTMRNNIQALMDMVYRVSDVHFGFVAFNGIIGTSPTTTFSKPNWDYYYLPPGTGNWLIPQVYLNNSSGTVATNYSAISSILPQLRVYGKRDTGVALQAALDQLDPVNGYTRTWASRAVVLFTDGPPTHDAASNFNPAGALAQAVLQAQRAHNMGIPIYIINCDVDTQYGPGLSAPAYDETIPGSICNTAGHGSKYYELLWQDPTTTGRAMLNDCGNVGRQLNTLLH